MKSSILLVTVLALSIQAAEVKERNPNSAPPPSASPPTARQGRGFDFLAPFRGIFGRPRSVAGPHPSAAKQHGLKPAASETSNKPNQAAYPGNAHESFKPFSSSGFEGFGEYGPPAHYHMPKYTGGKPHPPPKHGARPHRQPQGYPHGAATSHHGQPPSSHYQSRPIQSFGPNHGPSYSPAHGPSNGPHHEGSGHYSPQSQPQQTYHTFAEPQIQHHHYHAFQNNPETNELSGPPAYYQGQSQQSYDGPQTAQQFSRPQVSRPGPSGSEPSESPFGFEQAPVGFGDFSGFGPAGSAGSPGSQAGFLSPQPQGSGTNVRGPSSTSSGSPAPFFGGAEEYPEQYEEQNRNVRQPEIITADNYYQNQGAQYEGGPQGDFNDGFFGESQGPAPSNTDVNPTNFGFPQGPGYGPGSGPVHKSHPLRSHGGGRHRPSTTTPSYGSQEESRKQHYLYRPVSSSIRVPGAVDEDAVYGRPMMMSASFKRAKMSGFKPSPVESEERQAAASQSTTERVPPPPFKKPGKGIMKLQSPSDPTYPPMQSGPLEPDTAASGHGGHHQHFDHHGLESSNGDRILYHVAGHQGPYSYRFGYDTGKGDIATATAR